MVKGRRSVRKYQDRTIPDSEVEFLIDLARHAPSSLNGQPWHFVVVKSDKTKAALVEIKNRFCPPEKQAYQADFLLEGAPDHGRLRGEKPILRTRNRKWHYWPRPSSCWEHTAADWERVYMSAYISDEPKLSEAIRKELGLPEGFAPISILPLGYPDEIPRPKELRPLQEIIHFDQF